ncbi:MAG: ligase-associated DNA damage response DEXH box helicase [Chitinophagaceae bacterium]|nr:ligase-associated DNA damage response DEXH box helicase [Chitinophagaceae bacterium]
MKLQDTKGYSVITSWLHAKERQPFLFQEQAWEQIIARRSGLVNAPTGCGKTFSVFLGALIDFINLHPSNYRSKTKNGLQLLWITPLRALAKDIGRAMDEVITDLEMSWKIGIRNGDTTTSERQKQKRQMPEILIITPESLQLLLAQKGYEDLFQTLRIVAVDEWHELLGSKRGVQVELALSRIRGIKKENPCSIIGISATIGNLDEAKEVLTGSVDPQAFTVRADIRKQIDIESVFPDEIEKYPWAGHLGLSLVSKVIPIILGSTTTLIFINTRGMSERWYQALLDECPELSGVIALHHGSIEQALRLWVEDSLHTGKLKAVVCTASLDLGVDFRPVETVIQVGSPKGVARFLQRAGRSGHQPDAVSKIYFLPTHSLELVEAAALKAAAIEGVIESRVPMILCFDVLVQYLCTLAVSDGFYPDIIYNEIRNTYCYQEITPDEFQELLSFITSGGTALQQYDEYKKVEIINGLYKITSRRIAMRHRMHIGTIVSDAMLKVKFFSGGYIGVIEEYFISKLNPGDVFTLAGRNLEFVVIKDMTVLVRKSSSKKSIVPSWNGGRMPLSANLGFMLRRKLNDACEMITANTAATDLELKVLSPLFTLQEELSHIPRADELLIEHIETKDGFHLFVYPFEGRLVHEAMAALLAFRISRITPITFSFAMNDYGFELLSDQPIPVDDTNVYDLFSDENLLDDIRRSLNAGEMAKRKFRDISVIGGLIFQGLPGEHKKARHLQSSASLIFKVFSEYEPNNLLLKQAYHEVMEQQMEEVRLRNMLRRIQQGRIAIQFPKRLTPFCFPIKVDSIRENISSEKLEDRVKRMQLQLEKK